MQMRNLFTVNEIDLKSNKIIIIFVVNRKFGIPEVLFDSLDVYSAYLKHYALEKRVSRICVEVTKRFILSNIMSF